jgi:long-subunit fatty acid transport protein
MKKLAFILVFTATRLLAQNDLGTWNVININLKVNKKWNVFTEVQLRSLSFYDQYHYYEYKGGATYKINDNFSATTGIGSYNTFSEGGNFELPMQNKEIRTWGQINMKNPLEMVTFEHRYRAEQRFTSNGYRNRFRYRLGATIPLNSKKIAPKTVYALIWNELFFTDKEPYFERNRFFIGGGYEISKNIAFQAGYIHQFDYKINDETGRDFLNISLLYNVDLTKKKQNGFIPTASD